MKIRSRHLFHRMLTRLRWSRRFLAWLEEQGARLGEDAVFVFDLLKSGYTAEQIEDSVATDFEAPTNTTAPALTGTAQEGETLTLSVGVWTGKPSFTYEWLHDGTDAIAGASGTSYTLTEDDVGHTIVVKVTATNAFGTDNENTAATAEVIAAD